MNRVCEYCKYFETSNIDRLACEEKIVGRYCYRDGTGIMLGDYIINCKKFEEVKLRSQTEYNNRKLLLENKHLKEKIRELEDELDIHQHHIAELESEEVE